VARPSRPPSRDAEGGPPAEHNRETAQKTQPAQAEISPPSVYRGPCGGRVCWRCGVPFAWSDAAALARCTELARAAALEERTAGLCPACAAGLAS
jgi:hypothetical protein